MSLNAIATLMTALCATAGAAEPSGESLFATCAACHDADAGGNTALGAPALAGQLESDIARQLQIDAPQVLAWY